MDTSIRFKSNKIGKIISTVQDTGILARYLGLYIECFTHKGMFEWFGIDPNSFPQVYTLEANFIMLSNNFVTNLIMKAWITCALEKNCNYVFY